MTSDLQDEWRMRDRMKFRLSIERFLKIRRFGYHIMRGSDNNVHVVLITKAGENNGTLYVTVTNFSKRQLLPVSRTDPRK